MPSYPLAHAWIFHVQNTLKQKGKAIEGRVPEGNFVIDLPVFGNILAGGCHEPSSRHDSHGTARLTSIIGNPVPGN
jgi:hypothetical protein